MRKLTIRAKITIWYASLFLVLILLFSFFIYSSISKILYKNVLDLAKADADQVVSILRIEGSNIKFDNPYKIIATNTYFVVFNKDGNAGLKNEIVPEIVKLPIENEAVRYISVDKNNWLVYDEPLYFGKEVIGWIRISRSLNSLISMLNNLKLLIFVSVPVYILIASFGGLFLANRALKPINDITKTASRISNENLTQRLKLPKTNDEVGRLSITFNQMLEKLETAFKRERQFMSDASHELRTPITVISAQAQEALSGNKKVKEYKEALNLILNESKKMSFLISQLLLLHKSDEGKYKLNFELLDLNMIIEEITKEFENIAKEKNIKINFISNKDIKLKADQTLITRLVVNLVNNAIKYGRDNGNVVIKIPSDNESVFIEVMDDGIGISEEDIPYIFDRFYQTDKSRSNQGTGLGLAISKWIVEQHNGEIKVESSLGKGTKFTVKLPLNPAV